MVPTYCLLSTYIGHFSYEVMSVCGFGGSDEALFADVAHAQRDVVADGAAEQHRLLAHHACKQYHLS